MEPIIQQLTQIEYQNLLHPKQLSSNWNYIESEGKVPSPRSLHIGFVIDDAFYVFGGYDGTHRTNDFFKFDFLSCKFFLLF